MLERLRLPLKRKRSLSSEDPDPIKKETKCTYLQMTFSIFVLLLLVDFSVSSICGYVGFSFATYRYRYLFLMVPVRRFV